MSTTPPRRAALEMPRDLARPRWDDGAVSLADAALFTGMSLTRVRDLVAAGKLTSATLPATRNKVIPVASLRAYLAANAEVTEGEY